MDELTKLNVDTIDEKLAAAFGEICDDVYVVGDAKKPGNVWNANTTAFDAAMMI